MMKDMMKKFNLLYWQHYSSAYEVEAKSFEDAVRKLRKQFGKSEMAKVEDLDFDDDGIELIGEAPCGAKSCKRR